MSDSARHKSPYAPGDVIGGKYRVDRVIGAGGMGVVLAATHLDLDQGVAIKCILPGLLSGKGAVERFLREARAAVKLRSEHIARVLDVGRDEEGRPYMVLELLEGQDLSTVLYERGPLQVHDAVEYVLQACEALVEAHGIGLVHRDLKPQNLFVTRRVNGAPLVKVLDFGIAKAIGPMAEGQMALTDSAAIIGSPLYMAPEQMRSARNVDVRSDVWALGVILYECLVGRVPFPGETVTEICLKVVGEAPPSLQVARPSLPPGLVDVVMTCLAKDPAARPQDVGALARALEPFGARADGPKDRAFHAFSPRPEERERVVITGPQDEAGRSTAETIASDAPPPGSGARSAPALVPGGSTGTSWAGGSSPVGAPSAAAPPRRRLAPALAALGVLAAVAGGAGLLFGRMTADEDPNARRTEASTGAPSAAGAGLPAVDAAAPVVAAADVAPVAPTTSAPAVDVKELREVPGAVPSARGGGGGGGGKPRATRSTRPAQPEEPRAAPAPATPAPTAAPAPTPAGPGPANEAPILR